MFAASRAFRDGSKSSGRRSPLRLAPFMNGWPTIHPEWHNYEKGVYPANLCPLSCLDEFASLGENFG